MNGVVPCIFSEDFLTMALSNPVLQDLYPLLFHRVVTYNEVGIEGTAKRKPKAGKKYQELVSEANKKMTRIVFI